MCVYRRCNNRLSRLNYYLLNIVSFNFKHLFNLICQENKLYFKLLNLYIYIYIHPIIINMIEYLALRLLIMLSRVLPVVPLLYTG